MLPGPETRLRFGYYLGPADACESLRGRGSPGRPDSVSPGTPSRVGPVFSAARRGGSSSAALGLGCKGACEQCNRCAAVCLVHLPRFFGSGSATGPKPETIPGRPCERSESRPAWAGRRSLPQDRLLEPGNARLAHERRLSRSSRRGGTEGGRMRGSRKTESRGSWPKVLVRLRVKVMHGIRVRSKSTGWVRSNFRGSAKANPPGFGRDEVDGFAAV